MFRLYKGLPGYFKRRKLFQLMLMLVLIGGMILFYVTGYVQYYHEGDEIRPEAIGTLAQHFCRVKMMTSSVDDYCELVSKIQDSLKVTDPDGQDLIYRKFDIARLKNS